MWSRYTQISKRCYDRWPFETECGIEGRTTLPVPLVDVFDRDFGPLNERVEFRPRYLGSNHA